jgi:hypothetical protein
MTSSDPVVRLEALREMRALVAAAATDEEKQAQSTAPLWQHHEMGLFEAARASGLDGAQVRGLRDEAITLGQLVAERGRPATD